MTTLFGLLEHPLIQAPMAGTQAGAMAAAVSKTGALGSLPCAVLTAESMRKEVELVRAQTSNPLNVNFFVHVAPKEEPAREAAWRKLLQPYYDEYGIDATTRSRRRRTRALQRRLRRRARAFKPEVVSFHFGCRRAKLLARVKGWGSKVLASATTVAEAQWLEANGADAVIAQGLEAGGHRGIFLSEDLTTQVGTLALVRQVVAAVKIPVIAAGGIADAAGVRAVLALGASAAQVGTAFLLCDESNDESDLPRRAQVARGAPHGAHESLHGAARARHREPTHARDRADESPGACLPARHGRTGAAAREVRRRGLGDFTSLWSGQNPAGCREVPAAKLVESLLA
jgi:nitronate monooxygenase